MEQTIDLLNAIVEVFEKHLTAPRWRVGDDDEANGWVGAARLFLAESLEKGVAFNCNGDPAAVEPWFEDLRDYVLWQDMLDAARESAGEGCQCDCHYGQGS